MTHILELDQAVHAGCRRQVGVCAFECLDTGHFIVGNDNLALFSQFSGPLIEVVDGGTFEGEGLIFGTIEPVTTLMGVNGGFFLKASPHVWVRWFQRCFV